MDELKIGDSIFKIINSIFVKLFKSVDSNIYGMLDTLTFVDKNIISGNNFQKIIGNDSTEGLLLIGNSLILGCIIFFAINYLLSQFTLGKSQTPMQFIFKGIIFIIMMNFSTWICLEIIEIISIVTKLILNLGQELFETEICFSEFINIINKKVYVNEGDINIFSFEGIVKSFTSYGFINLVFTYSLRYILIQVMVLISPFAILCLTLDKTECFFKTWIKLFLALLLEQILVALILVLAFSLEDKNIELSKFLYTGIIYALIRANTYMRQMFGGLYTSVSSSNILQ